MKRACVMPTFNIFLLPVGLHMHQRKVTAGTIATTSTAAATIIAATTAVAQTPHALLAKMS